MKASMITACILCCLAQGLGFDFFSRAASFPLRGTGIRASIHTANGIPNNRPLMNRSFSSRGSLSFVRVLFPTTPLRPTITFRTASAPSRDAAAAAAASSSSVATKMVLRPDWEREGRVFGLRMPPKKKERAFEYLVDYPCEFEIKVIGVNEGSFADDIATIVSKACQVKLKLPIRVRVLL